MNIPTAALRPPMIKWYFAETTVQYYEPDDEKNLKLKLRKLIISEELRALISTNVRVFSAKKLQNPTRSVYRVLEKTTI